MSTGTRREATAYAHFSETAARAGNNDSVAFEGELGHDCGEMRFRTRSWADEGEDEAGDIAFDAACDSRPRTADRAPRPHVNRAGRHSVLSAAIRLLPISYPALHERTQPQKFEHSIRSKSRLLNDLQLRIPSRSSHRTVPTHRLPFSSPNPQLCQYRIRVRARLQNHRVRCV